WRTKGEYVTLLHVGLRTCTVAVRDLRDVEHSVEVTAETLYEAIATALAALQQDNWVGEIGQGFTTVTVVVQQPPVKHEVKMKDFGKRQGKHTIDRFNPQWVCRFHYDRWNDDCARFLADWLGCKWKNSEGARQVPLRNGMTLAGTWSFSPPICPLPFWKPVSAA